MKLQQLRALVAVVQNNFNITTAAIRMGSSQPAMSRQLRLLEEELGFDIFTRNGTSLVSLTPRGERVMAHASRIFQEERQIADISDRVIDDPQGRLSIATTHTQARYILPQILRDFRERYPNVQVDVHQGNTEQIAELVRLERVDFALASGNRDLFKQCALLPAYELDRCVLVPPDHPLTRVRHLSLERLAEYPLVTYVFGNTGRTSICETFRSAGLVPQIALSARSSDIIKTYVRMRVGVGIIAGVAIDPRDDTDLVAMGTASLFPRHATWVGVPRGARPRGYVYYFLGLVAPHLTRAAIDRATAASAQSDVDSLFAKVSIPVH